MNIEVIRPASRLNSSSSIKITGVYYHREKLYVGFSNGDLSIYDVDISIISAENSSRKAPLIRLLKSLNDIRTYFSDTKASNFSHDLSFPDINGDSSPINQIQIISTNPVTNRIIFIVANADTLRIFEKVGSHLNLVQVIEEGKFFNTFYCYTVSDKHFVAIAVKKKLLILQMRYKSRNIFHYHKVHELVFKERVKAISSINCADLQLLIGLSNDFLLVNVNNQYSLNPLTHNENDELMYNFNHSSFSYFGLSSTGPSIWICKISDDNYLLIKDSQTVLLHQQESSLSIKESHIKLTSSPIFVSLIYPAYLLVVYNKKVEIIEIDSGDLIQKIHHQINSGHIPTFVNESFIFLGALNDLLQFNILTYQQQIDQFLRFGDHDRRNSKKDPTSDLSLIGLQKAISFVNKLDEEDEYFGGSRVGKEKRKQLYLRDLYKQKAFILFERYDKYHESLVGICSEWLISYKDVLGLFPDFLNVEFYSSSSTAGLENEVKATNNGHNGKSAVKKITLEEIQQNKFSVTTADSGTENEADHVKHTPGAGTASLTSRMPSTIFGNSKSQGVRKFSKAVNNLVIYLTDQRRIHLNFLSDESFQWKGINVVPSDLYDFITPELASASLEQIAVEIDTSLFLCYFHCKPMLLGPLLRLPNNKCDSHVVKKCLLSNIHNHNNEPNFIKELLDFNFGRGLHEEALEMLHHLGKEQLNHSDEFDEFLQSPSLTIQYLRKLDNDYLPLIFKYSEWLLSQENPEDVLENGKLIFMNDTYECESYDNFKVLDYFLMTISNEQLAIKYLEWIIFESDLNENPLKASSIPKFHTKLCLLYLNQLKSQDMTDSQFETSATYTKLYNFLKTTELYEPWTVLKHIPTNEVKLLRFTIFIYKRLGEHDKALDVLYNQLEDLDAAIMYCADIYSMPHSKEYGTRLLHKLFEDLLMHYTENIDSIAKLLTTQGSKMSVLRVLTSLPNSFPIRKLNDFLRDQLRLTREQMIDKRISSQLYKVGATKLEHELLTKQSESYVIESSKNLCSICHKKLGYSVFSVNESNQVVHYACQQR